MAIILNQESQHTLVWLSMHRINTCQECLVHAKAVHAETAQYIPLIRDWTKLITLRILSLAITGYKLIKAYVADYPSGWSSISIHEEHSIIFFNFLITLRKDN